MKRRKWSGHRALTAKQQKAMNYIQNHIASKGEAPTFTEIKNATGVTDLKGLRRKGLIDWSPRKARSIVVRGTGGQVRTISQSSGPTHISQSIVDMLTAKKTNLLQQLERVERIIKDLSDLD